MASGRLQGFRFWFWNNPTPTPPQQLPSAPKQSSRPSPSLPTRPVEPQNGVPFQQKTSLPQSSPATKAQSATSPSPSPSSLPAPSAKSGQSQSLPQTTQRSSLQSPMIPPQLSKQFSIESPTPQTSRSQSPSHDASNSQPEVIVEIVGSTVQSIPMSPQIQSPGEDHSETQSLPSRQTLSHPPSQAEATDANTQPKTHPEPIETEKTLHDVEPMTKIQPIVGSTPLNHTSDDKHDNGKPPLISEESKHDIAAMPNKTVDASNILLDEAPPAKQPIVGSTPLNHTSDDKHDNGKPPLISEESKPDIAAMPNKTVDASNILLNEEAPPEKQPIVGSTPLNRTSDDKHDNGKPPLISEESKPDIAAMPNKTVDASNILLDEEAPPAKPESTRDAHASESPKVEEKPKHVVKEDSMVGLDMTADVQKMDRQESNTTEGNKELRQPEKPPTVLMEEKPKHVVKEDSMVGLDMTTEVQKMDRQESNTTEGNKELRQPEKPPTVLIEESKTRMKSNLSDTQPNSKPTRFRQWITEPLMEIGSSMQHKNENASKGDDQNMIGSTDLQALTSHGKQASLRKDIKEGIGKLVQKLNYRQSHISGNETAIGIITLAGENKGVSMYISHETLNKTDPDPIKKDHMLEKEKSSGSNEKKPTSNEKSDQEVSLDQKITINSNVQDVINSLLHDSSCRQEDPGVHVTFSGKSYKPVSTEDDIEAIKTSKSVVGITPAESIHNN